MTFKRFQKRIATNFDWILALITLSLCVVGLVVVYSADYDRATGQSLQASRQAASMGAGFLAFFVCMTLSSSFWQRWALPIYITGIVLVAAVEFVGVVGGGARRWLILGPIRLQPSEFMKLGLILMLAKFFSSESAPRDGYNFMKLLGPAMIILFPVVVVAQEDLGTALCQVFVGGSMLLLAGVQTGTLVRLFLAGLVAIYPAWEMLKDYQRKRILNFLTPDLDPLGSGYHAIQSKIAVGSGSVFGKGFLQGTQSQLRFLPEQTTDFIFSVLAEEWGFFGSIVLLLLYGLLVFRLVGMASKCQEKFSAFVVIGVGALVFWQVVVNMGMVTGVLPVVGITLPLLSYGGSSVTTILASLGLAAGLGNRRYIFAN